MQSIMAIVVENKFEFLSRTAEKAITGTGDSDEEPINIHFFCNAGPRRMPA